MVPSSGGRVRDDRAGRPDESEQAPAVDVGTRDGPPLRDDLFEAVDNRRRRYTIHYLQQCDGDSADLSDVATQVAAWELDEDPCQIAYSDRKNVRTALYQFHAPKLDDLGVVEYGKRQGTVRLTEHGERLWVDIGCVDPERSRSWRAVATAGGGGLATLALAAWLAAPNAGLSVAFLLAVALLVGFCAGAWYVASQPAPRVVEDHPPTTVPGE